MLIHERGYLIAAPPGGGFAFYRPDGTAIPACPALPAPEGAIEDCHDAGITPETIIPPWYGEKLDLDHAIYVCFANARNEEEKRAAGERQAARGPVKVYEPEGWEDRIRQYYDQQPQGVYRVVVPIPV